ncbi:MAG: phosphatidylglycerol lysyltransferase domain-containing protein [Deltaproteobacteria bacterium]
MDIIETMDLKHRPLLSARFRQMNLCISDYTFANVYLFRNISRYEILTKDCGLFISAYNRQEQNYIMPLDTPRDCSPATLRQLLTSGNFFFPIPEEWLPFFPENEFCRSFDDGDSDYIYLTANMASFAGKQYTRHRNHLNQFIGAYHPERRPLSADTLPDGLKILHRWQDESIVASCKTDFSVCVEALHKFPELALWGTIYYIENDPAGFIIGEALNNETFCLHFAKGSKAYHGIYEFMFNDTAKQLQSQYKYMNLEEDMGNKNLRRTKTSYGPDRILKKYRVSLGVETR